MVPRGAKPLAQVLIMDGPEKLKIHQKSLEKKNCYYLNFREQVIVGGGIGIIMMISIMINKIK